MTYDIVGGKNPDVLDDTPGTCQYVPVRTDLYRPVLCYRMYRYVLLEKCLKTVQVGTYRYVPVQENVKKYVRVRTQLRTERYRAVQGSTGQYTKWYKAVQVKVQQGTRQYMAVHVSTRSAFAPGRGRGGRAGGPSANRGVLRMEFLSNLRQSVYCYLGYLGN